MPQSQPRSTSAGPRSVSKLLIAAGVDGYPERRDAAALGAPLARAADGEPLLAAVHPDPPVVLPAELGWTAIRKQAEETLRPTRDEGCAWCPHRGGGGLVGASRARATRVS